ncbi:MAG: cob(I)yrinic acid a,c-diamide adenosyltransferase [Bdellovibrionota bacterium]
MTKIYTKTGDQGQTALFTGERVEKHHPLILAYGTIDELNAFVGVALSHTSKFSKHAWLSRVQCELFDLGTDLALPESSTSSRTSERITTSHVQTLEQEIDEMTSALPELKHFILPGGSALSAHLHVARTVCRRAERWINQARLSHRFNPQTLIYANRLSDWLFVMARLANHEQNIEDLRWEPRA